MKEQGITVPRPEFLTEIPKRTVARSLTMRRTIEELTGEECSMLIELIKRKAADKELTKMEMEMKKPRF